MSGEHITRAMTRPISACFDPSSHRSGRATTPITSAATRKATFHLFRSAAPVTAPSTMSIRVSFVRISLNASHEISAQKKQSNAAVDRR
jgi:hypothetical protein